MKMFSRKSKTNINSHKTEEILLAAREASAWCALQWNPNKPRSSLRTLEFSPEFFGTDHYYTVNSMIYARRYKLEAMQAPISNVIGEGEILVYKPDENIFDGLSESETGGYVDVNDCPPWDTWIGYIAANEERVVLSWVPDDIVSLVNYGAEVNCTDCFYWLSESNEKWATELTNKVTV